MYMTLYASMIEAHVTFTVFISLPHGIIGKKHGTQATQSCIYTINTRSLITAHVTSKSIDNYCPLIHLKFL